MKKDRSTDVLSFPIRTEGPDGRFYLGDIVISVERAAAQARRLGHGLDRELAELAIHGFVHLLGYDHGRGHEREETRARRLLLGPGKPGGGT